MAQRFDIVALVDDEHRHRTDDVETRYQQDERQEEISHRLLNVHDVKHLLLLFQLVHHLKSLTCQLLHFAFRRIWVGRWLKAEFECCDATRLFKEPLCEGKRGDEIILVVLALVDIKTYARRGDVVGIKALARIGKVDAFPLARSTDLKCAVVNAAHG